MRSFVIAAILLLIPLGLSAPAAEPPQPLARFLTQHCFDCHQGDSAEAALDLDALTRGGDFQTEASFAAWDMVWKRVRNGEMPPADYDQPDQAERTAFVRHLQNRLRLAEERRIAANGRAPVRRLNRTEYQNVLRDVLALPHLDILESLPPDGSDHGYDKSSSALDFSHVHVARMLETIDVALAQAGVATPGQPRSRTVRAELAGLQGVRDTCIGIYAQLRQGRAIPMVGDQPDPTLVTDQGDFAARDPGSIEDPPPHLDGVAMFINGESNLNMAIRQFRVLHAGMYRIRVHGMGIHNRRGDVTPSDRVETVGLYTDDRTLGYCDLPSDEPGTAEIMVWLEPGDRIKPLVATSTYPIIRVGGQQQDGWKSIIGYGALLQWFELEGPFYESWPPESHQRLYAGLKFEQTEAEARDNNARKQRNRSRGPQVSWSLASDDPAADAERLIKRFAERAYRRPVTDEDLEIPLAIAQQKLAAGKPIQESLVSAYRAILASPGVVLLEENVGPLNDYELASRLSFFLWSSPPDEHLLELAKSQQLSSPEVLQAEVNRMLKDPRAERFVTHFLDHWLTLKDIHLTEPDANLYPEYNPLLLDSMLAETRQYFATMIAENLSVDHIVDSEFTFANQRLAELYGIEDVLGNELRRVSLQPELRRGGLLTQASLLKVTANGTTTSPVTRGAFVMTHILGDPPPPPPASVPAIEPDISGATTIREQLAAHREIESCAACHRKIDPPGFALESYDVMGGWRERYRSVKEGKLRPDLLEVGGRRSGVREALPVDASGEMPGNREFADIDQFRTILLNSKRQLADNLLRQLVVYSTGSPVGHAEAAEFEQMLEELAADNYGVRSMIQAVVASEMFQTK